MKKNSASRRGPSRREILLGSGAAFAYGTFGKAPTVLGQAKEFKGVTLQGQAFSHYYMEQLRTMFPEFEELTGAKVNLQTQGFFNFNQRMDLELSTGGSSFDFANITFIYMGRWVGFGWFQDLEPILSDPNWTEPDYDRNDFVEASTSHILKDGHLLGIPWLTDAAFMACARHDILEKKGLEWPKSFDEMMQVCEAIDGEEGVKAYVNENNWSWTFTPYLMGFGGNIFKDPPGDLTPTLDTPEAAEAIEYYAHLLRDLSPSGVLTYTNDQSTRAQLAGRANFRDHGVAQLTLLVTHPDTTVAQTTRFGLQPEGPNGYYPGIATHAWGIPQGSPNPRAAWEFIKWATSKKMYKRMAVERGYSAIMRKSVLSDPEYVEKMTLNGQNVAELYSGVLARGGTAGYMKYRTVPVFPQMATIINKSMERVVSRQQSGKEALAQAQREAIADLKKAGVKIDA